MKPQALFSSKDKSNKKSSFVCCNFAWQIKVKIQMSAFLIYQDINSSN